ncbi:hypothetical protein ENUP19_0047G0202 [Entamoeba nuttalli]|uniref:Chorein N-terminal domain-containing protein n=2 Tax=Entamoeba nuttalli TaxID=412467 RepID=K2H5V9_ENTNP|nr:hypothetical protein ENU1_182780 [Entamoeba nuttalli P19]EKE37884.1 hypothetical protein ENU1_182780 [Entamoeba nuttalli P19]|eukprot:XP_008859768.1 hypothetical protein ENU1_182780 [Entamoeba nuttalli P19]
MRVLIQLLCWIVSFILPSWIELKWSNEGICFLFKLNKVVSSIQIKDINIHFLNKIMVIEITTIKGWSNFNNIKELIQFIQQQERKEKTKKWWKVMIDNVITLCIQFILKYQIIKEICCSLNQINLNINKMNIHEKHCTITFDIFNIKGTIQHQSIECYYQNVELIIQGKDIKYEIENNLYIITMDKISVLMNRSKIDFCSIKLIYKYCLHIYLQKIDLHSQDILIPIENTILLKNNTNEEVCIIDFYNNIILLKILQIEMKSIISSFINILIDFIPLKVFQNVLSHSISKKVMGFINSIILKLKICSISKVEYEFESNKILFNEKKFDLNINSLINSCSLSFIIKSNKIPLIKLNQIELNITNDMIIHCNINTINLIVNSYTLYQIAHSYLEFTNNIYFILSKRYQFKYNSFNNKSKENTKKDILIPYSYSTQLNLLPLKENNTLFIYNNTLWIKIKTFLNHLHFEFIKSTIILTDWNTSNKKESNTHDIIFVFHHFKETVKEITIGSFKVNYQNKNITLRNIVITLIPLYIIIESMFISIPPQLFDSLLQKLKNILSYFLKETYTFKNLSSIPMKILQNGHYIDFKPNSVIKLNKVNEISFIIYAQKYTFFFPPFNQYFHFKDIPLHFYYYSHTLILYSSSIIQNLLTVPLTLSFPSISFTLQPNQTIGLDDILLNQSLSFQYDGSSFKFLLPCLRSITTSYHDIAHSLQIINSNEPIPLLLIKSMKTIKNALPYPIILKSVNETPTRVVIKPKTEFTLFPLSGFIYTLSVNINEIEFTNISMAKDEYIQVNGTIIHLLKHANCICFYCNFVLSNYSGLWLNYCPHKNYLFNTPNIRFLREIIINDISDIYIGINDGSYEKLNQQFKLVSNNYEYFFSTSITTWFEDNKLNIKTKEIMINSSYQIHNSSEMVVTIWSNNYQEYININETIVIQKLERTQPKILKFGILGGKNSMGLCWSRSFDIDDIFNYPATIPIVGSTKTIHTRIEKGVLVLDINEENEWSFINNTNILLTCKQKNQKDKEQKLKIYKKSELKFNLDNPFGERIINIQYYYKGIMNKLDEISLDETKQYKQIKNNITFYIKVMREPSIIIVSNEIINKKSVEVFKINTIAVDWGFIGQMKNISIKIESLSKLVPSWCKEKIPLEEWKLEFYIKSISINEKQMEIISAYDKLQCEINMHNFLIKGIILNPPDINIILTEQIIQKIVKLLPNEKDEHSQIQLFPVFIDNFNIHFSMMDYSLLSNINLSFPHSNFPALPLNKLVHSLYSFYKSQILRQTFSIVTSVLVDHFPLEVIYQCVHAFFPSN